MLVKSQSHLHDSMMLTMMITMMMEMKHLSAVFYLSIKILFCHSKGRLTLHHDCNPIPPFLQSDHLHYHRHHLHHHHHQLLPPFYNLIIIVIIWSPLEKYQSNQKFGRIVSGIKMIHYTLERHRQKKMSGLFGHKPKVL